MTNMSPKAIKRAKLAASEIADIGSCTMLLATMLGVFANKTKQTIAGGDIDRATADLVWSGALAATMVRVGAAEHYLKEFEEQAAAGAKHGDSIVFKVAAKHLRDEIKREAGFRG